MAIPWRPSRAIKECNASWQWKAPTRSSSSIGARKIAEQLAAWVHQTTRVMRALGDRLEAGQLEQIEALGPQRHIAILSSDAQDLAIGFTRSAALPYIRETMKQIEVRWAS